MAASQRLVPRKAMLPLEDGKQFNGRGREGRLAPVEVEAARRHGQSGIEDGSGCERQEYPGECFSHRSNTSCRTALCQPKARGLLNGSRQGERH